MNIGISKRRRSSGTSTSSQTAKKNLLRNIVVGREQTGKSSFSRDVLAFGSTNSQGHGVSAFDGRSTRAINVFVAENTKTKVAANKTLTTTKQRVLFTNKVAGNAVSAVWGQGTNNKLANGDGRSLGIHFLNYRRLHFDLRFRRLLIG